MSIHLTPKLVLASPPGSEEGHTLAHWCPGCLGRHLFNIEKPNACGAKWEWNKSLDSPSFTPSMNIVGRCHYFLTDGKLVFLGDCKHPLAGQTVDLPDFPSQRKLYELLSARASRATQGDAEGQQRGATPEQASDSG